MKVLQINSVCGIGSTGRIATDLHKILIEQGHESHIAFGRDVPKNCEAAIRIGTKFDNYNHVTLTRLFDIHGFGSVKATKDFIRKVEALNPDIIHLHNIHGYYINIKKLFDYLKRSNKPVVWTLHDCWSFTGHCTYFSYAQCDKWIDGCYNCPQKKSYPSSTLIDNSKRNYYMKKELFTSIESLTIVTPSKWLAGLVGRSFLAMYPVRVIHNGIDTDVFKPVDSGSVRIKYRLADRITILGVANKWDRRKGLSHFIELSKMIDDDCVIVLVGLDNKQIAQLPPKIIGIKKTSNISELAQIYSAADVFVNPSSEETFGLVTAEALACGTPAIVFDSTPGVEIVADGCGYVAETGNIGDVRQLIEQVKSKGKDYYSTNCQNRIRYNFDNDARHSDYLELFKTIIDSQRLAYKC